MKKIICILLLLFILPTAVSAAEYPSYSYLENGGLAAAPQGFTVENVLYCEDFGIKSLKNAGDIVADEKGNLYVSATEQNAVAVRYKNGKTAVISNT